MNENQIKTFDYEGSEITFSKGSSVMVNATEMAKKFGKRAVDWLQNKQTQEFINALSEVRKSTSADLVQVTKGGDYQGTWMHEDVALEFARWLSPKFAIWCNDRIKELLTTGVATASNDDEAILHAMQVLQQRVEASKALIQAKDDQITEQAKRIETIKPLADYTQDVLQSDSTYTLTQVAFDLGFRSVHTFTKFCTEHHILFKQSGQYIPHSVFRDKGVFATRTAKFFHSDGSVGTSISTVVTEAGRKWFHEVAMPRARKEGWVS